LLLPPSRGKAGMGVEVPRIGPVVVGIDPRTKSFSRLLRSTMTDAERLLWRHLRERQRNGGKFRRQHPIGGYIVDFVCLDAGLIVEVDGGQHMDRVRHDAQRTNALQLQGYVVLRFWNNEVLANLAGVVETIDRALPQRLPPPQPSLRGGGRTALLP
jgi:very-short-patch-repair endonuclease